jgi:putative transposase
MHAKVRAWLAQRPGFNVHDTLTYRSWLNQLERWFGPIIQRPIRRGSFSSDKVLIDKVDQFLVAYNKS